MSSHVNNPRYPGFSEYQSANSFQNSSYCTSFPKGPRFNSSRTVTDKMYSLPPLISKRMTGIGIGERKDLRPQAGQSSPPPDAYTIRSIFDYNVAHSKGAKLLERHDKSTINKSNPGPGTYSIRSKENKFSIPIKLKSRRGFFYDDDLKKSNHCVSMQKYNPNDIFEQNRRYTTITFGIGGRISNENACKLYFVLFFLGVKSYPGPGAYKIIGNFDKGLKKKPTLN